ncbi:response regulator transcription factor [Chloroflexota bacterium]
MGNRIKKIRLLIVDDSAVVRDGLCSILGSHTDFKIVGEAIDGLDAMAKAGSLHPDVILMDIQMPGKDGIEATRYIKEHFPKIKVLLLTVHTSYIEEALVAGADGCLLKDCGREELFRAISDAARGTVRNE